MHHLCSVCDALCTRYAAYATRYARAMQRMRRAMHALCDALCTRYARLYAMRYAGLMQALCSALCSALCVASSVHVHFTMTQSEHTVRASIHLAPNAALSTQRLCGAMRAMHAVLCGAMHPALCGAMHPALCGAMQCAMRRSVYAPHAMQWRARPSWFSSRAYRRRTSRRTSAAWKFGSLHRRTILLVDRRSPLGMLPSHRL